MAFWTMRYYSPADWAGRGGELYAVVRLCASRLVLAPRVLLDGPYASHAGSMMMTCSTGLLPDTEPYTGLGYVHPGWLWRQPWGPFSSPPAAWTPYCGLVVVELL
ncbi:MAG: hypothetical protein IPI07_11635 [Flavobacteriales bacterium]|nr:hypothetical protein [Flavobacteriales bacterium]